MKLAYATICSVEAWKGTQIALNNCLKFFIIKGLQYLWGADIVLKR